MNIRFYLLPALMLGIVSGFLTSCSGEDVLDTTKFSTEGETHLTSAHHVSLNTALQTADSLFGRFSPNTRSRMLESVDVLTSSTTRADESSAIPDTLLYLVNYQNDQGFALLSADDRLLPIYAISDEGHLSQEDFNENPGLMIFKNVMDQDIVNRLASNDSTVVIGSWPSDRSVTI